jgi:acetyl-CoA carboxylase biotin carboxyl carrier protein
MALSHDDVREILRIIDESDLDELHLETEGFSLHVRKGAAASPASPPSPAPPPPAGPAPPAPPPAAPARENETDSRSHPAPAGENETDSRSHSAAAGENETDSQSQDGLVEIPSPMLGTFYRAESPRADPFVEIGERVEPDTIVCIIEVMKMMNSIPAGVAGMVAEVCPTNGQLVEYGEPLFRVRPQ